MAFERFFDRTTELDAIVEQCRGRGVFASGAVCDASNRSSRDWPWWGIQIEQTERDGSQSRRAAAQVTLSVTAKGEPDAFAARWTARAWTESSVDSFKESNGWPLDWTVPTPECLEATMAALLERAWAAFPAPQ